MDNGAEQNPIKPNVLKNLVGFLGILLIGFAVLVGFATGILSSQIGGLFSDKIAHENGVRLKHAFDDPYQVGRDLADVTVMIGSFSLGAFLIGWAWRK